MDHFIRYNGRRPDHVDTVNIFTGMMEEETSAITMRHLLASSGNFVGLLLDSSANGLVCLSKRSRRIPLTSHLNIDTIEF